MPRPGSDTRVMTRALGIALIVVVAVTAVGCSTSSAPSASQAAATPSPGVVVATATPSIVPTASPTAPASATTGGAGVETPPDAVLSVDGGDPVEGQLGTYVWAGGGSDGPWLPGAPVAAATGEILGLTLSPDLDISEWSAVLAPASSLDGTGRMEAGGGTGPGPVLIPTPDPGAWTLAVMIRFGDLGSATWFWRLDVS
jgi:hypothetical protein